MANTGSNADRRTHPRIRCRGCTFVADVKLGRIVDLSLGGAAIYYADREPWSEAIYSEGSLRYDDELYIDNLTMQTVSDQAVLNHYAPGAMTVRRRSVRFVRLSREQRQKLAEFIIKTAHSKREKIIASQAATELR